MKLHNHSASPKMRATHLHHHRVVLTMIAAEGAVSRRQLSELTHFHPSTVRRTVEQLLMKGIVTERSLHPPHGGRVCRVLSLAHPLYALILDLSYTQMYAALLPVDRPSLIGLLVNAPDSPPAEIPTASLEGREDFSPEENLIRLIKAARRILAASPRMYLPPEARICTVVLEHAPSPAEIMRPSKIITDTLTSGLPTDMVILPHIYRIRNSAALEKSVSLVSQSHEERSVLYLRLGSTPRALLFLRDGSDYRRHSGLSPTELRAMLDSASTVDEFFHDICQPYAPDLLLVEVEKYHRRFASAIRTDSLPPSTSLLVHHTPFSISAVGAAYLVASAVIQDALESSTHIL